MNAAQRLMAQIERLDRYLFASHRGEMYVDRAHVQHVAESRHRDDPYKDMDDFSRRYVREVRVRIAQGVPPPRPLVEARPQLLYFRDAARLKRTSL